MKSFYPYRASRHLLSEKPSKLHGRISAVALRVRKKRYCMTQDKNALEQIGADALSIVRASHQKR